jgi:phage terminase large subunit
VNAVVQTVDYEFPHKLGFLFFPRRYKIAYGGRGGAKSWGFARALLLLGAEKPLRILCMREVQKSIKESVYELLCQQITALGLHADYDILATEIRGKNGTMFMFAGLSNQTAISIKSYEGVDICWVEEAQAVTRRSWDILTPTIRKDGSEIWISLNPELDTDETWVRFVENPPTNATVVEINYSDNPFLPNTLKDERKELLRLVSLGKRDQDDYENIWEGKTKAALPGAIYHKEVSALKRSGRLHSVPYDPMLKVHIVCDLGFNDYMSLLLVQRLASEIRIIRYIEDRFRDIPSYSQELKDLKLNYGTVWLPHDGKATTLTSANNPIGATAQEQFDNLGWTTQIVPNINREQGIRKAREIFSRVHIDKENATELVNRLAKYKRHVQQDGQATDPEHKDESHGSDGFRYMALVADQMTNDTDEGWGKKLKYDSRGIV